MILDFVYFSTPIFDYKRSTNTPIWNYFQRTIQCDKLTTSRLGKRLIKKNYDQKQKWNTNTHFNRFRSSILLLTCFTIFYNGFQFIPFYFSTTLALLGTVSSTVCVLFYADMCLNMFKMLIKVFAFFRLPSLLMFECTKRSWAKTFCKKQTFSLFHCFCTLLHFCMVLYNIYT